RASRSSRRSAPSSTPGAPSPIPTSSRCSARSPSPPDGVARSAADARRSEERVPLAAVGRGLGDDRVALDQVEAVEVLAELAPLRVAPAHAVSDAEADRYLAEQRRLYLAGALESVEMEPRRQPRLRQAVGAGRAGGDVAAAERGHAARRGAADDRQREAGRRLQREAAVVVEQR